MPLLNVNTNDLYLQAGDIVKFVFDVQGGNQTLLDLAIHQLKTNLANDARFDYQGSNWDEGYDVDQVPYRHLQIFVQVRKTPKTEAEKRGYTVVGTQEQKKVFIGQYQEAGANPTVAVVAITTLFGLMAVAVIAHGNNLVEMRHLDTVNGIALSDLPDAIKRAALESAGSTSPNSLSWSQGIGIAAIVVAIGIVIWLTVPKLKSSSSR
jgi:hypothetical protein